VSKGNSVVDGIASADISRIDLIVRWGGGRRLSGFLPVQSIYADFYVIDELWPDFSIDQFHEALEWYQEQDVTLGG
jgi:undecaprenyl diphosphate synthase